MNRKVKCPNCQSVMEIKPGLQNITCMHCGSILYLPGDPLPASNAVEITEDDMVNDEAPQFNAGLQLRTRKDPFIGVKVALAVAGLAIVGVGIFIITALLA